MGGAVEWLAGTTRRPACGPRVRATAWPGPVAYQRQFLGLTRVVMSRGDVKVRPSSQLRCTKTRRLCWGVTSPRMI